MNKEKLTTMRYITKTVLVYIISQILNLHVRAQQTIFDPFPRNNKEAYHLDFTQYFVNENDEKKDLDLFYSNLDRFYSFKNKSTLSATNLLTALKLQDSLFIQYNRHDIYNSLLASVNKENFMNSDASNKIEADFSAKTMFFEKELIGLSKARLEKYIHEQPSIKKYEFYITDLLRYQNHQNNSNIEEKVIPLTPAISGWQFELYEAITDHIKFSDIQTSGGKLNVKRDRTTILAYPDSSVRTEGFKKLYAGYNSMRDLYAFTLIKLANAANATALLYNFSDAAELYYFDKHQSKTTINIILRHIMDSVSMYRHYQQLRVQAKKKRLPSEAVHYWDLGVSSDLVQPRFTIDDASRIILSALQPLGNDYQKELADLLNPNNRRMEIAPDKNKRSGGFSRGFIGTNSVFFSGGFQGYYDDMRLLTHESTHAVHRQLMNINGVSPVYASGPNYFFESFAIFSEFLLSDYLIEQSKTNAEKQYYFELYDNKAMALFSVAADALFEQKIHEGVVEGKINNADDLDSLNQSINTLFSIWDTKAYPQLNQRWITANLFYEDPYYEVNYVLGTMLALKYYQLYHQDRNLFCKNYIGLLKNGFNATPQMLLKNYLDIDIDNPNLVKDAITIINKGVEQLEELYK